MNACTGLPSRPGAGSKQNDGRRPSEHTARPDRTPGTTRDGIGQKRS